MTFIKELTPRTSDFILDNIIRKNLSNKAFLERLRFVLVRELDVTNRGSKDCFCKN